MTSRTGRTAFTLTEVLVVIGLIVLILGLLLPALAGVRSGGRMSKAMGNMRQVSQMMTMYGQDNRDTILASQFNHHLDAFVGHPRCNPSFGIWHARGTWADVLWTQYEMGVFPGVRAQLSNDYAWDSPDKALYDLVGSIDQNILRSAVPNSRDLKWAVDDAGQAFEGDGVLKPFGDGAAEHGLPGYFAANNFFNNDSVSDTYNGAFSYSHIKALDRSVYLVDSFAGEVIEDEPEPWDTTLTIDTDGDGQNDEASAEVDYRYNGSCLLMFLDGHVDPRDTWIDLDELESDGKIRVRDLTSR